MHDPSVSADGLTLDKTVLDLRTPVFAHSQMYTAPSCVRCRSDSKVLFDFGDGLSLTRCVQRIVTIHLLTYCFRDLIK